MFAPLILHCFCPTLDYFPPHSLPAPSSFGAISGNRSRSWGRVSHGSFDDQFCRTTSTRNGVFSAS